MAKCNLCKKVLVEGGKDIHRLNKDYEMPMEIKWDGTKCDITNKLVNSICEDCLNVIMKAVNSCIKED